MVSKHTSNAKFTVPGLPLKAGHHVGAIPQDRLHALNDLRLSLKHAHWNVVGRDLDGVHTMLDPHIHTVRLKIEETSERMTALAASSNGLAGALVKGRIWDDYAVGGAGTSEHLAALDSVYDGPISSQREVITAAGQLDPVTEDMLIGHTGKLEKFQWFMRAHLQTSAGQLDSGVRTRGQQQPKPNNPLGSKKTPSRKPLWLRSAADEQEDPVRTKLALPLGLGTGYALGIPASPDKHEAVKRSGKSLWNADAVARPASA